MSAWITAIEAICTLPAISASQPNSPTDRANASAAPEKIDGRSAAALSA